MIRTRLYSGQGLGNQLWVYAAGRSIAEYHNTSFRLLDAHLFKGNTFLDIDIEAVNSNESKASIATSIKKIELHRERLYYDHELEYYASAYDERVEDIKGDAILEGFYQSERYFYSNRARLKEWVRLKQEYADQANRYSHLCIINVRGGEYKRHKNLILPKRYWENAINNMISIYDVKDFLIVTDDKQYASRLLPGIPVLDGSIGDCYAALQGAGYLILSNSSFSYFPIKTRSDAPPVIAPFLWSRPSNQQLRWASPANLYEDWFWQSIDGELMDNDYCRDLAEKTLKYYINEYNVNTCMEFSLRGNEKFKIIPKGIRPVIKRMLARLFPMWIG